MKVVFAGFFAVRLMERVQAHLSIPCDVIAIDEEAAVPAKLGDADVLVSMGYTKAMAEAGQRLRLVQVPGAGLDRVERALLPPGAHLANVYGHEVGIAEYIMGAMLELTRAFRRLDASLRHGRWEAATRLPPARRARLAG